MEGTVYVNLMLLVAVAIGVLQELLVLDLKVAKVFLTNLFRVTDDYIILLTFSLRM